MRLDNPTYPPTWRGKPPGLTWEDWQPWQIWLRGPGATWAAYAYDVEMLTQDLPPGETDPALLKMWARNTAKRIDAVGVNADVHDIFEARRIAGWSAIAQLLGYRDLWLIQFPALRLGSLYLVTERIDDPTRATAARNGIKTWVVGEESPA